MITTHVYTVALSSSYTHYNNYLCVWITLFLVFNINADIDRHRFVLYIPKLINSSA